MMTRFTVRLDSAAAASPQSAPYIAFYRGLVAFDQGQYAKVASIVQPVLANLPPSFPDYFRGALIGIDGLRIAAQGDTVRGLARADSGLRIIGGFARPVFSGSVSLRLGLFLASKASTRTAGIQRLRYGFMDRMEFIPIVQYDLAKAYEAAGDRNSAIASYAQFVRLWDHPDSNFQARVRDAKESLQRLTGEGSR
jgi:tetratricopeptide (TPR) repeat protein